MKTIKKEMIIMAIHQKNKHDLTDEECGVSRIEELFDQMESQGELNNLIVEKLAELESRIK